MYYQTKFDEEVREIYEKEKLRNITMSAEHKTSGVGETYIHEKCFRVLE